MLQCTQKCQINLRKNVYIHIAPLTVFNKKKKETFFFVFIQYEFSTAETIYLSNFFFIFFFHHIQRAFHPVHLFIALLFLFFVFFVSLLSIVGSVEASIYFMNNLNHFSSDNFDRFSLFSLSVVSRPGYYEWRSSFIFIRCQFNP